MPRRPAGVLSRPRTSNGDPHVLLRRRAALGHSWPGAATFAPITFDPEPPDDFQPSMPRSALRLHQRLEDIARFHARSRTLCPPPCSAHRARGGPPSGCWNPRSEEFFLAPESGGEFSRRDFECFRRAFPPPSRSADRLGGGPVSRKHGPAPTRSHHLARTQTPCPQSKVQFANTTQALRYVAKPSQARYGYCSIAASGLCRWNSRTISPTMISRMTISISASSGW